MYLMGRGGGAAGKSDAADAAVPAGVQQESSRNPTGTQQEPGRICPVPPSRMDWMAWLVSFGSVGKLDNRDGK